MNLKNFIFVTLSGGAFLIVFFTSEERYHYHNTSSDTGTTNILTHTQTPHKTRTKIQTSKLSENKTGKAQTSQPEAENQPASNEANFGTLSDKERAMIAITKLLSAEPAKEQLTIQIHSALNAGITPEEITAYFMHCAPYIGYPKTINAVTAAENVFSERKIRFTSKLPEIEENFDRTKK